MLLHSSKELARFMSNQRKQKQLSQAQLGSQVGLKQTTVSKFENRPETTQIETLFRLLSALELEMQIIPKSNVKIINSQQEWTEEW